jgi:hypothetical protein
LTASLPFVASIVGGSILGVPLLGVSVIGWIIRVVIGLIALVAIYVIGAGMVAKFKVPPPAEPDPDTVVAVDLRFRCVVCGAEVTMTAAQEGEEIEAPRHCREDMVRLGPRA